MKGMERIETMEKFWQLADQIKQGFLFAMLTDQIVWKSWPLSDTDRGDVQKRQDKLLDIRVFNCEKEARMFRGHVGGVLKGRLADDTRELLDWQEYFDEEQYLDIDDVESVDSFQKNNRVKATGGGGYELPLKGFKDAKIRLRNYLGYYEESGQAYVKDWRLMEVFQEER